MQLYPSSHNPYYIYAPPFERTSAGIKALYLLCHHLNLKGFPAYIIVQSEAVVSSVATMVGLDFLTPLLTIETALEHFQASRIPIFVYPEVVSGNPFVSDCVVRYVLNYPGLLAGEDRYPENELVFGYSKTLARATSKEENVLFIPTSDTNIFYPPVKDEERSGSCYYADKYKKIHKGIPFTITESSIEITRQPSDQTPQMIADLFRKCEVFYTYENTALATEAALCGCPAVFLPNPYLEGIIASNELGSDGFAWGNTSEAVTRAKDTVRNAFDNYKKTIEVFSLQLDGFIEKTQLFSKTKEFKATTFIQLHKNLPSVYYHKVDPYSYIFSILGDVIKKTNKDHPFTKMELGIGSLEKQLSKVLSTIGLRNYGRQLWNKSKSKLRSAHAKTIVMSLKQIQKLNN